MFNIAICDDEKIICAEIENIILNYKKEFSVEEIEVEVFYTGEELCKYIEHGNYFDLIFLDIQMNVINGIDVGLKIREEMDNQTTQIVYMSVSESYYRDLFRVRPTNFLGKPIMKEKIIEELRKAQKLAGKLSGVFTYKKGHDTYKIPIKKIIYFESIDREIKLISTDGEDSFYGSIDVVFTEVKKYHFMRIHRSYLINYFHVAKFSYAEIKMSNSTTLPISKSHQKWIRALQSEWEEEGL